MSKSYKERVLEIYTSDYISLYDRYHLDTVPTKYRHNLSYLNRFLRDGHKWLDVGCGSAWHFSNVGKSVEKVGVDISQAQIDVARKNNPSATFICDDALSVDIPECKFDLVTSFWGPYCYLDSEDQIVEFFNRLVSWVRPGGNLYVELLLPDEVYSFNFSPHSAFTETYVTPLREDYTKWQYEDPGGKHIMLSPPLEFFTNFLSDRFKKLSYADGRTPFDQSNIGKIKSMKTLNGNTPSLDPVSLGVDGGVRHLLGRRKIK
jgi:SAM-dependent methyltransferase